MKKFFILFVLAIVFVSTSFAQKGEKSIGLNLGYNTTTENTGIGARFQYNIAEWTRIAPSFNYYFENNDHSGMEANLDLHYVFPSELKMLYSIVGLNYSNIDSNGHTDSGFGVNIGAGLQIPISRQINLGAEYKKALIFDLEDMDIVCFYLAYKF